MERADCVLSLAESGALNSAQLARAAEIMPLSPGRTEWFSAITSFCFYGGALLTVSGFICFFAYNWAELPGWIKFTLAIGALTVCVVLALQSRPFRTGWRAALLAASVSTGALLALIGQTYQTGADMWQLFATWALLMLPFALAARSSASWLLWLLVANTALLRALSQSPGAAALWNLHQPSALSIIAAFNFLLLLALEFFTPFLLARSRRLLHRLAAVGALAPLATGAAIGWWNMPEYGMLSLCFFTAAAAAIAVYRLLRLDVAMLAWICLCLIAVMTCMLAHALQATDHTFAALNLLALFVIVSSAGSALWLLHLHKSRNPSSPSPQEAA